MKRDVPIRSISRSIAVLQAINRAGSLTMTEVAINSGVAYATAYRIVETLVQEGLLEQEPERKRYRPTALVQTLSVGFQDHDRLVGAARPHIVALTEEIHWPASVVTRIGHRMINRDSTQALTSLTFDHKLPGATQPMLDGPTGLAYLSFAPDAERESLLRTLALLPDTKRHPLLEHLQSGELVANIRQAGYATQVRSRINPKTFALAVPIMNAECVAGVLALILFTSAVTHDQAVARFLARLQATAAAISADLA